MAVCAATSSEGVMDSLMPGLDAGCEKYDADEDGAPEAIRLGKQLRFRPSALVRYLDARAGNGAQGHLGS